MALTQLRHSLNRALSLRDQPDLAAEIAAVVGATPFLRASGLASCARRQTYEAQHAPRTPYTPESQLMMIQGDWGEVGMRRLIGDAGYTIRDEQRELSYVENGDEIVRGHIDGIIGYDNGALPTDWSLWEMKMMSAFRFKKLDKAASVQAAAPNYYDQVQLYMGMLRQEGEFINSCTFTAVAKDPSAANMGNKGARIDPIYLEEIPFDIARFTELLARAKHIRQYAVQGDLAPRERDPRKDWDCSARFCPFYEQCDPAGLARAA